MYDNALIARADVFFSAAAVPAVGNVFQSQRSPLMRRVRVQPSTTSGYVNQTVTYRISY